MNQALLTDSEIRSAVAKLHISEPGGTTVLASHFMITKSLYARPNKQALHRQLENEIVAFMAYEEHKKNHGKEMVRMTTEIAPPVICGVEITTDSEGRFNLNALHKASGLGNHKKPSEWLRSKQARELVKELESNLSKNSQSGNSRPAQKTIMIINGGTAPGTFAHELLAIEYAGWIAPAFRLQVNQTFLDYRTGKLMRPAAERADSTTQDLLAMRVLDLSQELLNEVRENRRLRAEQTHPTYQQPTNYSLSDHELLRERDELAERLGQSRNYATIEAVERRLEREFGWHRLRNWCLRNNVEPLVLPKFQCVNAWPRGAWLAMYGVDLEQLFG